MYLNVLFDFANVLSALLMEWFYNSISEFRSIFQTAVVVNDFVLYCDHAVIHAYSPTSQKLLKNIPPLLNSL